MGTNIYFFTNDTEYVKSHFKHPERYLTDSPALGYKIHICKASAGWRPLFREHLTIKSVQNIKEMYNNCKIVIYDEYGDEIAYDEFINDYVNFNRFSKKAKSHLDLNEDFVFKDISYYTDPEGYEFINRDFV